VPHWNGSAWVNQAMSLRTYGFPSGGGTAWGFPGPTLRVRKGSKPGSTDGDQIRIKLVNNLPLNAVPDDQCLPTCPAGTNCAATPQPACCTAKDTYPECFHGINTTNLHFHGTHVSPQPPQDYVLLELLPAGSTPPPHAHGIAMTAVGTYQYAIQPIPWNQAEGTHWYHPHKHGSTSVQLINGLGGALVIEGPFDDWLRGYYAKAGGLTEQLMVIQQVDEDINFFKQIPNYATPLSLVNGQANPVVTMKKGEIQRWRLVNETIQAAAHLEIDFESEGAPRLMQIAQDGVQFAPQNYDSQPLLQDGLENFTLAPGNRADFLVQAPTTAGTHVLTQRMVNTAQLEPELRQRLEARDAQLAAKAGAAGNPPLLTVVVSGKSQPMSFPTAGQWPPLPSYLADIQSNEVKQPPRDVLFSMLGNPGVQPNSFYINAKQYDAECADLTMTLDTAEQWTVENSSRPQHPFHIHTNPFQILAVNGVSLPAPWIWWDTFGLPSVNPKMDFPAGPIWNNDDAQQKCPKVCAAVKSDPPRAWTWNGNWTTTVPGEQSVCGCATTGNGSILIRQRFKDFTGDYVIHCHFLGHEDRGMMLGVQAVCPPGTAPLSYGRPRPGQPECVPGNLIPAAPQCSASP
jgi:FtsP/CotA-like multicopper oxidase with cupredoxin domain